jgi:hypothetical protein
MKKSFRFDFEDYIAGTAFLNRREKGAYMDLICCQASKGRLTLQDIKDILNGDFDCWEKLKSKYKEENGLYYSRKLETVMNGKHKKTEQQIIIDLEKIERDLKEKKHKLVEQMNPFIEKYPKEMLRAFYNYWVEPNKSRTKVRYELEQCFDVSRRLSTWASRDKEFNKIVKSEFPLSYREMIVKHQAGELDMNKYEPVTPGDKHTLWKLKTLNQ